MSNRTSATSLRTTATMRLGQPIAAESSWTGGVKLSPPSKERWLWQGSECRGDDLRRSCTGVRILATPVHVGALPPYGLYDGTRMDASPLWATMLPEGTDEAEDADT